MLCVQWLRSAAEAAEQRQQNTKEKQDNVYFFHHHLALDVACSPLNAHHTYIIIHGAAINFASSHDDT